MPRRGIVPTCVLKCFRSYKSVFVPSHDVGAFEVITDVRGATVSKDIRPIGDRVMRLETEPLSSAFFVKKEEKHFEYRKHFPPF